MNKASHPDKDGHALGLGGAWAMAVGGMIGGGIFSTLGVVIAVAGEWAWLSFLIGGLIALASGHSYSALTRGLDESGGAYSYLYAIKHPRLARIVVMVLVAGYTLTVSVYAVTFGAYAANVFGGNGVVAIAIGSIVILAGINLLGATESAMLEMIAVWGKLVILLVFALVNAIAWIRSAGQRWIAAAGFAGSLAAAVMLVLYLFGIV